MSMDSSIHVLELVEGLGGTPNKPASLVAELGGYNASRYWSNVHVVGRGHGSRSYSGKRRMCRGQGLEGRGKKGVVMYERGLFGNSGLLFGGGGAIPPLPTEPPEIHITDMQGFNLCRRKWDLSSQLRRGLQPAILPEPLFMGQGIHLALDHGYRECNGKESMAFDADAARSAFTEWVADHQGRIDAYSGPLWADQRERIQDNITMGLAMLAHYAAWVRKLDGRYRLLGTEQLFKVPIPRSKSAVNPSGLQYAGRLDGLIQDKSNDLIYILEFKTAKSIATNALSRVFRGLQPTAYLWAARQLYDQPVVGVLYRVLRKRMPDTIRLTKRGTFSYNKTQKLTVEWIDFCLDVITGQIHEQQADAANPAPMVQTDVPTWSSIRADLESAAAGVKAMARGKPNEFFVQKKITRSQTQLRNLVQALQVIGAVMADPHTPIPPMSGYHCGWCKFSDPCDLMDMGKTRLAEAILEAEYAPRDYWDNDRTESQG